MSRSIVYMFHAIGSGEALAGSDPYYAYSIEKFKQFLNETEQCRSIKDVLAGHHSKVVVTFDDGHISNFHAAEIIKDKLGGSADFFINPNTVDTKHYLNWSQLREMVSMGMSIQSHSLDHLYLSDMSKAEQKRQLETSKKTIEDKLDIPVSILAPPGGRYNQDTIDLCHELGYEHLSVSEPGKWSGGYISPRLAVYKDTKTSSLLGCSKVFSPLLVSQLIKYKITGKAKTLLGNESYELIRSKILGGTS